MNVWLADTRVLFTAFVALVALQRIFEVRLSARNARSLLEHGGRETGLGHLPAMIALHVAFLFAAPAEVWLLGRSFVPTLGIVAGAGFLAAQLLRFWVLRTLGSRWTVRVIVVPGSSPVTNGPYRFLRHPNYVAVVAEIFLLPLIHAAWITSLLFSLLNAAVLFVRIRAEEAALCELSDYSLAMGAKPRFVPRRAP